MPRRRGSTTAFMVGGASASILAVVVSCTVVPLVGIAGAKQQVCLNAPVHLDPVSTKVGPSRIFKDPEQIKNAEIIKGVALSRKLSERDKAITLTVPMVESGLYNLSYGDANSLGLYQQQWSIVYGDGRPYWGTKEQVQDPVYATNRFIDELQKLKDRDSMPMAVVAYMTQNPRNRSAYAAKFNQYLPEAEAMLGATLASSEAAVATSVALPPEFCTALDPAVIGEARVAIQAALSMQGKTYSFGAGTNRVFDGSEFTQWAYAKMGVSLPLGASAQNAFGKPVSPDDSLEGIARWQKVVKPGDLLYWAPKPGTSINRVAIYVGGNQLIDSRGYGQMIELKPVDWDSDASAVVAISRPPLPAANTTTVSDGWQWPLDKITVTSKFGMRFHPVKHVWMLHDGVDFVAHLNQPVYVAADGVTTTSTGRGFGNQVTIDHGGGIKTGYAHLNKFAFGMNFPGVKVKAGQVIGYAGTTGWSTGVHLHFKVIENGTPIDPLPYMRIHGLVP